MICCRNAVHIPPDERWWNFEVSFHGMNAITLKNTIEMVEIYLLVTFIHAALESLTVKD